MDKEDIKILKHISVTLDEMLAIQKKPQSRAVRVFEIVSTAITIAGVIGLVDIVIKRF